MLDSRCLRSVPAVGSQNDNIGFRSLHNDIERKVCVGNF